MLAGTVLGMLFLTGIDGKKLKKIIGIAILFSMIALIIKMIVSAGTTGNATGISGVRLVIAAVAGCFVMISLPALVLNIVLLCVMLIAVISMFKEL